MFKGTDKFSKVIVHYVIDCDPRLALFDNISKGEEWVAQFLLDNQQIEENYISLLFIKGELIYSDIGVHIDESDYCG